MEMIINWKTAFEIYDNILDKFNPFYVESNQRMREFRRRYEQQ